MAVPHHFARSRRASTFRMQSASPSNLLLSLMIATLLNEVVSYSIRSTVPASTSRQETSSSRRQVFAQLGEAAATLCVASSAFFGNQAAAIAAPRPSVTSVEDDINTLADGANALGSLLENWDRATVDCTYADVPRELLEAKNKELLLEKASTFALFDKSTSVVSCKKNNRIVRDYIGATGKGPLVGAEKRMLRRAVADRVDPDRLDEYFSEVENFSQAISRASSLSYAAGIADFDSVNNFEKGKERETGDDTNLEQARRAIGEAKTSMDRVVGLLRAGSGVET